MHLVFLFFFFPSICSEKPGLWHSQKGFPETQIRVPAGGEGEASLVGGVCTGEGGGGRSASLHVQKASAERLTQ